MTLKNFDELLKKYAHLLINKGLGITEGDYLQMNIQVEQAPLARLLVQEAYKAGAVKVITRWSDDVVQSLDLKYQSLDMLTDIPQYRIDESNALLETKTKRLSVVSSNPDAFKNIDPDKISQSNLAMSKALERERIATQANEVSWLVAAAAGVEWAKVVFPNLSENDAVDKLWDQIFSSTRIYAEDPVAAWDAHESALNERADFLNKHQFEWLHYTGPGTDLKLGLPKGHVWEAAGSKNQQGEYFIANMPTEEVFTAPHTSKGEGYIVSSKPLSYGGVIIDGMTFHFKDGKIIKATAEKGEETLQKLLNDNQGATALGEVALVPHQSPISQSGIIFFNTLFDENASNHLALGQAYATSIQNGTNMSQNELAEAGLNRSNVHVDFMVGNGEMNIDGILPDGSVIPIFRQGEWAI